MSLTAIIVVGYGASALFWVRPVAGHFAWQTALTYNQRRPDGSDWAWAVVGAVPLAVVWPAVVLFVVAGWRGPVIGAEREAQILAREERIRQAERELGIVP